MPVGKTVRVWRFKWADGKELNGGQQCAVVVDELLVADADVAERSNWNGQVAEMGESAACGSERRASSVDRRVSVLLLLLLAC